MTKMGDIVVSKGRGDSVIVHIVRTETMFTFSYDFLEKSVSLTFCVNTTGNTFNENEYCFVKYHEIHAVLCYKRLCICSFGIQSSKYNGIELLKIIVFCVILSQNTAISDKLIIRLAHTSSLTTIQTNLL